MTANNSWGCDLKQVVGRIDPRTGVATDSIDPAKRIRCETLESMRGLAATKAFVDCPIHLTPAEAQAILELAEDRAALLADWASALAASAPLATLSPVDVSGSWGRLAPTLTGDWQALSSPRPQISAPFAFIHA